jgi:hypothetical protein
MLRHHALKPHVAGGAEQIGADVALLERRREDAFGTPLQQPGEVGLAQMQGHVPDVVAKGKEIERVEVGLVVVLAECRAPKSENPRTSSTTPRRRSRNASRGTRAPSR